MIAARPRKRKTPSLEGQTIVGKNFKLVFISLVFLVGLFAGLGILAEFLRINANALWQAEAALIGFIGGLLTGKTAS